MKRLVIAVDCDDVLVRTTPFFVNAYNEKYGTTATLADSQNVDPKIWGADEATILERWAALTEEDEYKLLGPDPEEVRILHQLSKQHELHLITARKPEEREFTQALLERELPGVFTSMEFVGWTGSKGEVCERIGAHILVDDNSKHLHDALRHGLLPNGAILFGDYPWNKSDIHHPDVTSCHDWLAVKKAIDIIAEG